MNENPPNNVSFAASYKLALLFVKTKPKPLQIDDSSVTMSDETRDLRSFCLLCLSWFLFSVAP